MNVAAVSKPLIFAACIFKENGILKGPSKL
jgi:hypothetical protein